MHRIYPPEIRVQISKAIQDNDGFDTSGYIDKACKYLKSDTATRTGVQQQIDGQLSRPLSEREDRTMCIYTHDCQSNTLKCWHVGLDAGMGLALSIDASKQTSIAGVHIALALQSEALAITNLQ